VREECARDRRIRRHRDARLKAQGLPFGRYRHRVFDPAGEPCWDCGDVVRRLDVAGRAVFVCAGCQPDAAGIAPAASTGSRGRRAVRRPY
jgi:hypothetical protein